MAYSHYRVDITLFTSNGLLLNTRNLAGLLPNTQVTTIHLKEQRQ